MITQKHIKSLLSYDPKTGHFRWLKHPGGRAHMDRPAGWVGAAGHRYLKISGIETTAARCAWFYVYGKFPKGELQHINGDCLDCRIKNLRLYGSNVPEILTAERLRSIFSYDPLTGIFIWINHKKMNGKIAGCRRPDGRIIISVDGISYRAHRLAWFYVHGRWPSNVIDHINGNPSDNRFINLREATQQQNMANSRKPITNKSGYKGVSWSRDAKKWQSHIRINGKSLYLGLFTNPKDAYSAYCKAAIKFRGEFARNK